jgi:hypothetical protein
LQQQGLSVALVPGWFDVDTEDDLSYLQLLLAECKIDCPFTHAVLRQIGDSKESTLTA